MPEVKGGSLGNLGYVGIMSCWGTRRPLAHLITVVGYCLRVNLLKLPQ